MPGQWQPIAINNPLYLNLDDDALTQGFAALENCYINDGGGHSRFPGLADFASLTGDTSRVYLYDWKGSLMAATAFGNLFRVNHNGAVENVTGVPISGGRRVIFTKTDDELVMAAGGPIIRFAGERTELLSASAPEKVSHVQFIDSFLLANEADSGRFVHSPAGDYRNFDPLDTFAADSNPDPINCMLVTPYRELLLGGVDSIEQYERLTGSGDTPFFRRWAVGEGVSVPYSMVHADNATWVINKAREFVRFSGQTSQPKSTAIQAALSRVDDWSDAWVGGYPDKPLNVAGQNFLLLQLPNATNSYGSKGLTFVYDFRNNRFLTLYGWNAEAGLPVRYPAWSHWTMWDKVYVGGEGRIYELTPRAYSNASQVQRMLGRTAHMSTGEVKLENLRMRLKRGAGGNASEASIMLRCQRDSSKWSRWVQKGLGRAGSNSSVVEFGAFGFGHTFRFEWQITDSCPVEIVSLEAQTRRAGF